MQSTQEYKRLTVKVAVGLPVAVTAAPLARYWIKNWLLYAVVVVVVLRTEKVAFDTGIAVKLTVVLVLSSNSKTRLVTPETK